MKCLLLISNFVRQIPRTLCRDRGVQGQQNDPRISEPIQGLHRQQAMSPRASDYHKGRSNSTASGPTQGCICGQGTTNTTSIFLTRSLSLCTPASLHVFITDSVRHLVHCPALSRNSPQPVVVIEKRIESHFLANPNPCQVETRDLVFSLTLFRFCLFL